MHNRRTYRLINVAVIAMLLLGIFSTTVLHASAGTVVAYDMVGSASQNLVSYTNVYTNAFGSAADGFQKYQRGVSPSIPYAVLDDSFSIYAADNLGIIKEGNTDEFFGATDTQNGDNAGPVSAEWVFDISGASGALALSIDMGAMGDFESSDYFVWEYSIDGGAVETAFASTVDEAGSYTYILDGGSDYPLDDPMLVDGTILTNDLQTFTTDIIGSGSTLTLTLTLQTDGGSEAMAFQNILISTGDVEPPPPPVSYCGEAFTPIYEIQGNGATSPLENAPVEVEGVVVGIFQDGFDGFFIQDAAGDSDMATSDGIFVYSNAAVSEGDLVRVDGTVKEFFDLTEIGNVSNVEVCSTGNSVDATVLTLPLASTDLEPYEGMLVTIPQTLYINEYFNFDRYGHIVLSSERLFQPSAIFDPESPEASQLLAANQLNMIKLDDGYGSQNPDPAYHPNGAIFDLGNLFRGGDTLDNVTGVVNYSFGEFMIEPTMGADYTSMNPRTAAPDAVGGGIKVASFNVLNYFTTLDDGVNDICGPAENMECRGADNTEEFERQRAKIIAALAAIDADVIGLIEIENNLTDVATADLVSGLNDMVGAGTYGYVATGAIGTDAIRQAFIYKTASVSMVGSYAVLDSADFMDPLGSGKDKNRPALAQTFMDNETGGIFTVVVNHLKSKGSACDGDYDPIAGNCDLTRTLAAEKLVDWLAGDPTGSNDGDFLIIGDLNSYDKEAPIDALIAGGFGDMVYQYLGENAYSYVFDSQLGYLDHALANADLAEELTGVTIWHINADEPDLIDYDTSYKKAAQDALYAPDPYRSSDHDPVIVGLDVCDEIAPVIHSLTATPDELWPANHKYVDIAVELVATDNFDQDLTIELISVTSSEEDEGLGDGDFPDDIVVLDTFNLQLRAERSGVNGEGRIYTLTYLVTDDCGNSATQSVTVFVPFSQSKN